MLSSEIENLVSIIPAVDEFVNRCVEKAFTLRGSCRRRRPMYEGRHASDCLNRSLRKSYPLPSGYAATLPLREGIIEKARLCSQAGLGPLMPKFIALRLSGHASPSRAATRRGRSALPLPQASSQSVQDNRGSSSHGALRGGAALPTVFAPTKPFGDIGVALHTQLTLTAAVVALAATPRWPSSRSCIDPAGRSVANPSRLTLNGAMGGGGNVGERAAAPFNLCSAWGECGNRRAKHL